MTIEESLSMKDLKIEWPLLVNNKDVVAYAIFEAMVCKTWVSLPRKADVIVEKLTELCHGEGWEKVITDDFWLREFASYSDLLSWIEDKVMVIPEIREMNLSNEEYARGIGVDDESRGRYVFSDRYSPACPQDEDFVDLDAYSRNLAHDIIRQHILINFSTFPGARHYKEVEEGENG